MGCGQSQAAVADEDIPLNWSIVEIETNSGDIVVKASNGVETRTKFNFESEVDTGPSVNKHFVEQKIGGTWDESDGKIKLSLVDKATMAKIWKEIAVNPEASQESKESNESNSSNNSLSTPTKVFKEFACNGVAECKEKGKTWLMTGEVNGTVNILDKGTGEVVLTMWQGRGGFELKFYDCLILKKGFRKSSTEEEIEQAKNAFCGTRKYIPERTDPPKYILLLKPEVLEKIPVSLFAMAAMYASFDLNGVDC